MFIPVYSPCIKSAHPSSSHTATEDFPEVPPLISSISPALQHQLSGLSSLEARVCLWWATPPCPCPSLPGISPQELLDELINEIESQSAARVHQNHFWIFLQNIDLPILTILALGRALTDSQYPEMFISALQPSQAQPKLRCVVWSVSWSLPALLCHLPSPFLFCSFT